MTDVLVEKTTLTLDDLMKISQRVEIIDGEMVEMAAADITHHLIGGNIYDVLKPFAKEKNLGIVFFDGLTYLMFSDTGHLKDSFVPDVSFIRTENIIAGFDLDKPYPGIPDLAIEVISPSESAADIQTKLRTYLAKGTEQVWIVYPTTREVHQYRRDNNPEIRIYKGSEKLDVEALFLGLELTTDMIFNLPAWAFKSE